MCIPQGVKARVLARTLKEDKADAWSELGEITSSFQTFAVREKAPLLDVKLVWEGGKPEFYEMTTFHQELPEEPEKPAPTTSKGDEPAPVVEVPEFTGGVNGVEAAVHEVPEYTEAIGTAGDEAAPVVEVPEFTGGVNGAEAAIHEVPEYTEATAEADKLPAPVVEVPEFTGGVNGTEAAVHEVPEYTGGVNGVEAAVHEVPEFTGHVNGSEGTTHEVPEFTGSVNGSAPTTRETPAYTDEQSLVALAMSQDKTYQAPASHPYKLPETGTKENAGLAAVGVVGALLGMFAMGKKKDDE